MKRNAQRLIVLAVMISAIILNPAISQNYNLNLDGSDDYVEFGSNSPTYANTMTIEAWIKTNAQTTEHEKEIVSWGNSSASVGDNVQFRMDYGKLVFGMHDISSNGDWVAVTSNQFINTGEWMHVAVVKNGTDAQLYVNGVPDNSGTINKTMSVDRMAIGAFYQWGSVNTSLCFPGEIDEVRIWHSARTAWEIREYMFKDAGTGMAAYYKSDSGSGTSLTDDSGNGYTGTLTNGPGWSTSDCFLSNGNALTFDGINDHIWFPSGAPAYPGSFTIEGWIKTSDLGIEKEIVCWGSNNSSVNDVVELRMSGGKLEFGINDGSWESLMGSREINTGRWTHVAVTKNGSSVSIYVNGIEDGNRTINKNPDVSNLEIGNLFQANQQKNYYFPGSMDEMRVWDVALSESEIRDLMYKNVNGNWSNLLVCFRMNQGGTVATLFDGSGNYYHGYMNNFSLPSDFSNSDPYLTWTGSSSETWNTASNWHSGSVPGTYSHVSIPSGVVSSPSLSGSASVYNLYVENNATLKINKDGQLTVNNGLFNRAGSAGLLIRADSNGMGSLIHHFDGVEGTVECYFEEDQWHGVTPSVSGASADVFEGIYLKYYTEVDSSWTYITNPNQSMEVARGYFAWKYDDPALISWEGTLNNGDLTLNLSYTSTASHLGQGWNMIGNPYPSSVDFDGNWISSNLDGTIYLYDGAQYVNWNPSTGAGSHGSGYIPPGQAFWVHAFNDNPSIEIPQNKRTHSSQAFYKSEQENVLTLDVAGNGYMDQVNIVFLEDATMDFDPPYDGYKLFGVEEAPQLYMAQNGINYSLNCVPQSPDLTIALMLETGAPGLYTLTDKSESFLIYDDVYLEDLLTGDMIHLTQSGSYSFQSGPDDDKARFLLHFYGVSGTDAAPEWQNFNIYSANNTIYVASEKEVSGKIEVFDLLGKKVFSDHLALQGERRIGIEVLSGFYIVTFSDTDNALTKKIFIK